MQNFLCTKKKYFKTFSCVLYLLGSSSAGSQFSTNPPAGDKIANAVTVRDEFNGAGPTNIFHLRESVIIVVDPLANKLRAFDLKSATDIREAGDCSIPRDFRAWRLVRHADHVTIVSEGELNRPNSKPESLDVPHDLKFNSNCRLSTREFNKEKDSFRQLKRIDNRTIEIPGDSQKGLSPFRVKSKAVTLLSVRELERHGDTRYVFAKAFAEDDGEAGGKILVDMFVLRYDTQGILTGSMCLRHDNWIKRAFDYATVLPSGDVVQMWAVKTKDGKHGKIYLQRLAFLPLPTQENNRGFIHVIGGDVQAEKATPSIDLSGGEHEGIVPTGETVVPRLHSKLTQLSSSQITAHARKYLSGEWIYPGIPKGAKRLDKSEENESWQLEEPKTNKKKWYRPSAHRGVLEGTVFTGMPYSYGGSDTPEILFEKVKQRRPVGQLGDPIRTGTGCLNDTFTAGIDCSAFVARAWSLDPGCDKPNGRRAIDTRSIGSEDPKTVYPGVCQFRLPKYGLLAEGDTINKAGNHVVLFIETLGLKGGHSSLDGASLMVRVLEAASRCSGVCESIYELDYFHGWTMHRRKLKLGPNGKIQPCPAPIEATSR